MSEIPKGYIIVHASAWQELVQYKLRCQELSAQVEALQSRISTAERVEEIFSKAPELSFEECKKLFPEEIRQLQAESVQDFIQFMYSQDNCQLCNSSLDIASQYAESILKGEVSDDKVYKR